MTQRAMPEWGAVEDRYADEFGLIAPDVYAASCRLWPQARKRAQRMLNDNDTARAQTLLLKAAAQVTRAREGRCDQILELDAYLFQAFKRVLLSEASKDDNRRRFEQHAQLQAELRGQAENVERRILLNEIIGLMDEWTRNVFEWLSLNYSFEEIGQHLGADPKVVRNRFHRQLARISRRLNARADSPLRR